METEVKNIAETLAAELPKPVAVHSASLPNEPNAVCHYGLPKGWTVQKIDNEPLRPAPRRITTVATMGDVDAFIAYVKRHADANSVVWCAFDPSKSVLHFTGVFDEHGKDAPGWRAHQATYQPRLSPEWQTWMQHNKQNKGQVAFAEFIESNEQDIAAADGYPTSLQMQTMATEFELRQDQRLKSIVRLQSGGVALDYVAEETQGTVERMKVFEKFMLALPVFWSMPKDGEPITAYQLRARLRYRQQGPAVNFYYDLIRPDLVHQKASLALIARVREGIGATPLLLGGCA